LEGKNSRVDTRRRLPGAFLWGAGHSPYEAVRGIAAWLDGRFTGYIFLESDGGQLKHVPGRFAIWELVP
jgi:hypothetical protein